MKGLFLLVFVFSSLLLYAQGPGGVGTTDGTSNLVLWLKHDAGVEEASGDPAETNDDVEFWRDQSGYGNDLSQSTSSDRPMFNGSAVEFRGDAAQNSNGEYMDMASLDPQTIIIVVDNMTTSTSFVHGFMSQVHSGSSIYFHAGTGSYILSFDGTESEQGVYALNGEDFSASAENHGSTAFPGTETLLYAQYDNKQSNMVYFGCLDNGGGPQYRANYDIKEVIVYDTVLTTCERAQVEAYLEERYGLSEADLFDESASGSNGVQSDIDGIKELGSSDITSATSDIATLTNVAFLTDFGDALYIGHAGESDGYEYTDAPGSLDARWRNYWWADYTSCASNSGNVTISFDLSPNTPTDASIYRLLTSGTTTFAGATGTSGATINGNSIEFTVSATDLNDAYFTWGSTDISGTLSGPDDIASGITLWLMQDAGVEEAAGDAAEAGDDVLNWLDQSGNLNHATMTGSDKPSYSGSSIQFRGTATGNSIGEYFDIANTEAQTVITVVENVRDSTGFVQPILSQNAGSNVYLHFFSEGYTDNVRFSWDGTQAEEGRLSENGGDFSTAVENLSGSGIDSDLQLLYSEWTNNQTDLVFLGGLTGSAAATPSHRGNYEMKEIITYNRTLTACEKAKIETYLAAKYSITDFDYYESPGSSFEVAPAQIYSGGSAGSVSSDSSGSLVIEDVSFLSDPSDGIGFANNSVGGTSTDVPGGLDARIGTIWYLNYESCDGNNGNIKLRFKLDGGDCGSSTPTVAANYTLLHHSTTTMSGATEVTGATINGDYIEFTVGTAAVGDRYVSLASADVSASPLGVTGPASISDGLTLWLKSDCGLEEAENDAAEASDGVYRWKDQSGAGNHAVQTSSGDRPIYNGSAIQFTGDATGNTNGEYLELSVFEGQTVIAVLDNVTSSVGGVHGLLGQSAGSAYVDLFVSTQNTFFASFDGALSQTGAVGINGTELTADAQNAGSEIYPDSLTIGYFEFSSNQDDHQYLGGFTRDGSTIQYRANYDLYELIVFNRDLTCTERADIEAYLSAKYSINMVYDHATNIGDNGINTDVLVIEENNSSGTSSTALTVTNVDYTNDCVDTLWIAHDGATGTTAQVDDADMSGLAGSSVRRWTRIWSVVTATNDLTPDDVTLVFDLDEYSTASVAGGDYRLITSASPWSYATVVSGPTIDVGNNTVSFTVDVDEIAGRKFTLATTDDAASPLPISLLDFDAAKEYSWVNIEWSTATEINNDYFEVERSADNQHWTVVDQQKGAGNSTAVLHYSAIDRQPLNGQSYYRLKQVDFDGTTTYSERATVRFSEANDLHVFPNPAENSITISSENLDLNTIEVLSVTGQSVRSNLRFTQTNNQQVQVDISNLSTGIYFLRVGTEGISVKLVKR